MLSIHIAFAAYLGPGHGGRRRRLPDKMPKTPHLGPPNAEEQQLYFEPLPDVWAPHPISKAESSPPKEEAHSCCLYLWPCSFSHCVQLVTIGEGWDVDGPVNWELYLKAQLSLRHNGLGAHLYYCWCCPNAEQTPWDTLNQLSQTSYRTVKEI